MKKSLETGRSRSRGGFTIVEVVLVLALIALVAGLFAVNFEVLLNAVSEKRPEKVLHDAICEARYQTLQEHSLIYLSFNQKDHQFQISKPNSPQPLTTMPLNKEIQVTITPLPPAKYSKGHFEDPKESYKPIEKFAFAPDGSSQPVIITLTEGTLSLKFKPDPLSCGITSI